MNRRPTTVRVGAAALSSVALMTTLSACGGAASGESAESLSEVSLVFEGVLTVCTDSPYAPFVYEEDGKLVGFDVDLSKQVADDLGVEIDVIDVAFDDITSGSKLAREFDTGEQYGMAVTKDGNLPLLREINSILAGLREDGSYDKIYDKYFG